jgi:NlpC/P60 family putative phage cell wall peptidase
VEAEAIVREARAWIGTPYRHGAAVKGVGCDCLGLVLGVRYACSGERLTLPAYAPDWAEASGQELLQEACDRVLCPGGAPADRAGLILLFRWRPARPAGHLAIASGEGSLIHAHARAAVAEIPFGFGLRRRLVAAYRFPEML